MDISFPIRNSLINKPDINLFLDSEKLNLIFKGSKSIYKKIQIMNAHNNSTKILNKKNAFQRHDKQLSKPKKNVKIKLINSKYFNNELLIKRVYSPLKREYESLKTNLPNSGRYFKYLKNSDLDSIFKYNDIYTQKGIYYNKEIKNPQSNTTYRNRQKNISINQGQFKDFISTQKKIYYRRRPNHLESKAWSDNFAKKNFENKTSCLKGNIQFDFCSVKKNKIKLVDKSKKFIKLKTQLKKQKSQNNKLILDIKKEETINKNVILSLLAKFTINKTRIRLKSHH